MRVLRNLLLIVMLMAMAGCGSHDPVWRMKAQLTLLQLQGENAAVSHPDDYAHIKSTFQQGETLLLEQDEAEEADQLYRLAYQKGVVLKQEVALHKERIKEEARLKAIEERAIREEEERIRLEAERKRQQELEEAQKVLQKSQKTDAVADAVTHPVPLTSYTVRRGETLPQLAAKPEIYNDMALWPLIYRANRDQIRDPYQLWPGQTLKIPRNFSREEALEARRQAHRRAL